MGNALNWFEIPALDADRARAFYQKVLGHDLGEMPGPPGYKMYTFPADYTKGEVAGAVMQGDGYVPRTDGSLIYLNAQPDLAGPLSRVADAGGTVTMEKTSIGENGFVAMIEDTEGNKVGLHSNA